MPNHPKTKAQSALSPATKAARVEIARPPASVMPAAVAPAKARPQPVIGKDKPTRFTYALKPYTAERRADGWWICRTPFATAGEKPEWSGPFETIETAVLAIGRRLATEIADRHTRSIEGHKLKDSDRLYGLKVTTRLRQKTASTTL